MDRGQKVYLPAGSPLSFFYMTSVLKEQKLLYAQFAENKEDQLYTLIKGQEPKIMLDKLLEGKVSCVSILRSIDTACN